MQRSFAVTVLWIGLLFLSACDFAPTPVPQPQAPASQAEFPSATPSPTSQAELPPATPTPAPQPETPESQAELPAVTPAVDVADQAEHVGMVVRQAALQQLHTDFDQVEVVAVEEAEWPDGCLGLPATNENCLFVITPGYQVVLQVQGQRYVYRTDREARDIRLAEGPAPEIGELVVEWEHGQLLGPCQTARIGDQGVAHGACGTTLMQGYLAGPDRERDLEHFATTYAPFEADTTAGHVVFHGRGEVMAAPAEQRMLAEWARLVSIEAAYGRSGASWGLALAWHREGGIAGFCDDLTVYVTGRAYAASCRGSQPVDLGQAWLDAGQLEQIYTWMDGLQNFEFRHTDPATADAMIIHLIFSGAGGREPSETETQAILDFAARLYADLAGPSE